VVMALAASTTAQELHWSCRCLHLTGSSATTEPLAASLANDQPLPVMLGSVASRWA
jgi:hypothetical protein